MITKNKLINFKGFKQSPSAPTPEQLQKINRFTRREFKAEELYIGQLRLAHNAIDRDNERFSEEVLQGFIDTVVRKTMLFDHNRDIKDNAIGKFFDVEVEKMPLNMAVAELGEEIKLPAGVNEVIIMSPYFYIPVKAVDEKDIIKIDAGIFDFASIGFNAEKIVSVDDADDEFLFWEYRGSGETREGSLVYLGAQQGMSIKTADGDNPDKHKSIDIDKPHKGGDEDMKEFIKKLGARLGKTFTEEGAVDEIMAVVTEKDARIKELEPQAKDGIAYRKGLVDDIVKFGVMIDEIKADAASQKAEEEFLHTLPIDRLKAMSGKYEKQAKEKFPEKFQFPSKDDKDRQEKGEPGSHSSKESPLAADAKKRAEAAQGRK